MRNVYVSHIVQPLLILVILPSPSAARVACPMPHVGILTGIDNSLLAQYLIHHVIALMATIVALAHLHDVRLGECM